ncbi:MAG TPA: hypothetical protein VGC41_12935 [Kofleriaceae bacterium]
MASHETKHADVPKEDKHHDVAIPKGDSGIARVQMLLSHHHQSDPKLAAQIAEIIAEHEDHRQQILHWLHEHIGSGIVRKVLGAHGEKNVKNAIPDAEHAHHHDVSFEKSNPYHGQTGKGGDDPNRITDPNSPDHPPKLATASPIYRSDGTPYDESRITKDRATEAGTPAPAPAAGVKVAEAPAGVETKIQTGAVRFLEIDGASVECVLAFKVGALTITGWIPITALDETAHKELVGKNRAIAHDLQTAGEKEKYETKPEVIKATLATGEMAELRILPHQDPAGPENKYKHYAGRPGGVVNLLSNVPGGNGGRMGVAVDVIAEGTQFFKAKHVKPEHCPLWHSGDHSKQTNQQITFVYGKTADGRYGWINQAQLG